MIVGNHTPVTWSLRIAPASYALVVPVLHVGSFALPQTAPRPLPVALAVGLAAALSWPVFGPALLVVMTGRPSVLEWADVCLRTMVVGNSALLLSVAVNLPVDTFPGIGLWQSGSTAEPGAHGAVPVASNLTMAAVFVCQARLLGLRPTGALGMWFGVLGGTFLLILAAIKAGEVLLK